MVVALKVYRVMAVKRHMVAQEIVHHKASVEPEVKVSGFLVGIIVLAHPPLAAYSDPRSG